MNGSIRDAALHDSRSQLVFDHSEQCSSSSLLLQQEYDEAQHPQKEKQQQQKEQQSTSSTSNNYTRRKQVRFDKAEFRVHQNIIGDNPACSSGVPLTIDWTCYSVHVRDLGDEDPASSSSSMHLLPSERDTLLRWNGHSRREIIECCKPIHRARRQRERTLRGLAWQPWEEAWETASKPIVRVFLTSRADKKKRQYCKQWSTKQQQQQQYKPTATLVSCVKQNKTTMTSSVSIISNDNNHKMLVKRGLSDGDVTVCTDDSSYSLT